MSEDKRYVIVKNTDNDDVDRDGLTIKRRRKEVQISAKTKKEAIELYKLANEGD